MRRCPYCDTENRDDSRTCVHCEATLDEATFASPELQPIAPGTIFDNKFEVLNEIGRGGMGFVYRGQDITLGREVAIKVLPELLNTSDELIVRFQKEARAMAALDHPNIVPVYAVGRQDNYHFLVMKYLEGTSVAEVLADHNARGLPNGMPPDEVLRIVIEICKGLAHAHKRGLIHRDIKPNNIMLASDGHVTIMDFGIVKEQSVDDKLTRTGLVFGTPEYMAPEQAQGLAPPGPVTDLYSLGIVAYEMLSGDPPFTGDSAFSIVFKHIQDPPEPLIHRIPGVNQKFQDVIFRSIAKDPSERYQSADEFLEALQSVDLRESAQELLESYQTKHTTSGPATKALRTVNISEAATPTPPPCLVTRPAPPHPARITESSTTPLAQAQTPAPWGINPRASQPHAHSPRVREGDFLLESVEMQPHVFTESTFEPLITPVPAKERNPAESLHTSPWQDLKPHAQSEAKSNSPWQMADAPHVEMRCSSDALNHEELPRSQKSELRADLTKSQFSRAPQGSPYVESPALEKNPPFVRGHSVPPKPIEDASPFEQHQNSHHLLNVPAPAQSLSITPPRRTIAPTSISEDSNFEQDSFGAPASLELETNFSHPAEKTHNRLEFATPAQQLEDSPFEQGGTFDYATAFGQNSQIQKSSNASDSETLPVLDDTFAHATRANAISATAEQPRLSAAAQRSALTAQYSTAARSAVKPVAERRAPNSTLSKQLSKQKRARSTYTAFWIALTTLLLVGVGLILFAVFYEEEVAPEPTNVPAKTQPQVKKPRASKPHHSVTQP